MVSQFWNAGPYARTFFLCAGIIVYCFLMCCAVGVLWVSGYATYSVSVQIFKIALILSGMAGVIGIGAGFVAKRLGQPIPQ